MVRSFLSKLNFFIGRNPIVEKRKDWRKFIPEPYKAVVTITADFELAWAWRYTKSSSNPYELAIEKAKRERENIPIILELCDKYEIPITWATVGHLLLEKCKRDENGLAHSEMRRIGKFENEFWKFDGDDWYEYDPCSDYKTAPEWYAPDIIRMILNAKVKHEIGCHTFSHIDCRDEVCPPEVFEDEVNMCIKAADKYNIKLKSFVHPAHIIGNLNKLVEFGFTSFQTDPGNILGYPVKHKNGLWEMKRTYEFNYRKEWSKEYHIYRYEKIIERAIKNHSVCNFWFHPSVDTIYIKEIMPSLFSFIAEKKGGIYISSVCSYIDSLNKTIT